MTPLIQTKEDVELLVSLAEAWKGTRYAPDGSVKGHGCCCHMLPSEILREYGLGAPNPPGRGTLQKTEIAGVMESWLDACKSFKRLDDGDAPKPGDVVLIVAGVGHLGLVLDDSRFIHSWQHGGVQIGCILDQRIADRVRGFWRPIVGP